MSEWWWINYKALGPPGPPILNERISWSEARRTCSNHPQNGCSRGVNLGYAFVNTLTHEAGSENWEKVEGKWFWLVVDIADTHTYTHIHIYTYTHIHIYTYTYIHIYIYTYIHIYIYTYIHIYITLHYITLHYIPFHYITLHYITFPYITLHYITLHYTTLHYITLHYITLHNITLHYTTLHYITLHYITLHYTDTHTCIIYIVTYHIYIYLFPIELVLIWVYLKITDPPNHQNPVQRKCIRGWIWDIPIWMYKN